jgi:hypothetical protein
MKVAKTRASISSQTTLANARAPHGPPTAGLEPYFRGPNILTDPGFENYVANSGGWHYPSRPDGETNYVLPLLSLTCDSYLRLPNGECNELTLIAWAQPNLPYEGTGSRYDDWWKVSVHDPHSGDYHAVWWMWDNGDGLPPSEITAFSPFIRAPFSARVNAGDAVSWSIYCKIISAVGTPQITMILRFFRQNYSITGTVSTVPIALTPGGYTQFSVSGNAPPGTYYVRAVVGFSGGVGNIAPVFLDSAVLGVA